MEAERGKGREGSVRREEEGSSSKRRRIVDEHGGEEADAGGGNLQRWTEREIEEWRRHHRAVSICQRVMVQTVWVAPVSLWKRKHSYLMLVMGVRLGRVVAQGEGGGGAVEARIWRCCGKRSRNRR